MVIWLGPEADKCDHAFDLLLEKKVNAAPYPRVIKSYK